MLLCYVTSKFFSFFFCHSKLFILPHCREFIEDILNRFNRSKNSANVLEQEVVHKPGLHDFLRVNLNGDRQYLLSIKLNHFALFIFTDNGEEIQEFFYVSLSCIQVTATNGGIGG